VALALLNAFHLYERLRYNNTKDPERQVTPTTVSWSAGKREARLCNILAGPLIMTT
jgi:hypothetical protein